MKNTIEAVVAGHICLDLTPKFGQSTEETGSTISLTDILAPGKIIQMDGIELSTGGAVANTGIALSLMGIDASLMGLIGNDPVGTIVK
jgi:sugar/nucleoside kinase (ribokinase family)